MARQSKNFWDFSVALYASDGVANACLNLQNRYSVDVNLLLFCYWHGLYHGDISEASLRQAITESEVWRTQVIQPLRDVRIWMKDKQSLFALGDPLEFETLRSRIKFDELAGEKYQQELLEQICLTHSSSAPEDKGLPAGIRNVEKLLADMGVQKNDLIAANLRAIQQALTD